MMMVDFTGPDGRITSPRVIPCRTHGAIFGLMIYKLGPLASPWLALYLGARSWHIRMPKMLWRKAGDETGHVPFPAYGGWRSRDGRVVLQGGNRLHVWNHTRETAPKGT